jgi:hypothetical protein
MVTNIHIERLVLEGFSVPYAQRAQLQQALQAELARLFSQGGVSPALLGGGALPAVQAASLDFNSDAQPAELGRQIARSVYSGLGAGEPAPGGDAHD